MGFDGFPNRVFLMLAASASWAWTAADTAFIVKGQSILPPAALSVSIDAATHPLARQMNAFLAAQGSTAGFQPTGLKREDYLPLLKGQVRFYLPKQLPNGKVGETYATAGYILAASVLYGSGYDPDTAILASAMKAMDFAVDYLLESLAVMRAWRLSGTGDNPMPYSDFWTYPMMLALEQLEQTAPKARVEAWKTKLKRFTPEGYSLYRTAGNNWPLVQVGGEFLRVGYGMTDTGYVEWVLDSQKNHFTPYGMFMESGAPFAYDGFSRYFLTGILHRGYHGRNFPFYRDNCWKGTWTSLLSQSPHGEMPTGYRSAHHIWNEGQMAVMHEIYARQYARAGRPAEAGAFKRAARLALQSMRRWARPEGEAYVVKNRFPAQGQPFLANPQSTYSLLGAHMMAMAYLVADETIPEKPAPADVGGFAFFIPEFNMAFANAGGTYIQYMTRGTHAYNGNPTGLIRIHLRHGNPQLGPSDGVVDTHAGSGIHDLNVGPAWKGPGDKEIRLAEFPDTNSLTYRPSKSKPALQPQGSIRIDKESGSEVRLTAAFDWNGVKVTEALRLDGTGLTGSTKVSGSGRSGIRAYFPMLVFDGLDSVETLFTARSVTMGLRGDSVRYELLEPMNAVLKQATYTKANWNGVIRPIYADVTDTAYSFRISSPGSGTVGIGLTAAPPGRQRIPSRSEFRRNGMLFRSGGREPGPGYFEADGKVPRNDGPCDGRK